MEESWDSAAQTCIPQACNITNEPPCGKTNNVVSEQVWHKSGCTVTEAGWKLEISDLSRRGTVLSE